MVKIKICGLTGERDTAAVNLYKPDYVGLVFAPNSRRRLTIKRAAEICDMLDGGIKRVGVFADQSMGFINEAIQSCKLDVVQLHGSEASNFCSKFKGVEVWKAIRIKGCDDLKGLDAWPVDALLLDGSMPGSGHALDWNLLHDIRVKNHIILAGGLNPYNVKTAIAVVQPYAVDVSSGVETDGYKDADKIREFIEAVRGMEDNE
ncbi:phosphoribosylanthranilate isomerase [Mahella australiensis]|uniref:N-(5'-phosphoribosyl)anthranilate isomerase n=1 Tax=Mahella australiensis (strain DSM 15567 / CIP 107919 / 50-1 BON) TaxID=697281 RepID=F3ZZC5_MAHA5|nr:phosphoribosylanthranilate isomerase [Mahella australiensis]AEE95735.1 Phosphoribosylanthranilate isomerase [Mahella australiensis 50-1 BON]